MSVHGNFSDILFLDGLDVNKAFSRKAQLYLKLRGRTKSGLVFLKETRPNPTNPTNPTKSDQSDFSAMSNLCDVLVKGLFVIDEI